MSSTQTAARQDVMDYQVFVPYLTVTRACAVCGTDDKEEWARQGAFTAVRCRNCSLVWMDPSLTEEGLKRYYDHYIEFRLDRKSVV